MRILITTTYYLPNISGITIYIKILAEELVKRGHEVTILTSWHMKDTAQEEIVNGVRIIREPVWFYIGKGPIYTSFLWKSVKEIFRAEVINCHLPQPESVWVAFWSRLLGKKVFLTHHTDLSFWKGIKNKIIDGGVFVCQFVAGILATGIIPYTQDYAENSYLEKHFLKKVYPIYPPIKFGIGTNNDLAKKIEKEIKNKKYVIGFCGRIAKQKGIELLIESTNILDERLGDNYVILMAGPKKIIGENYYEYLLEKYGKILKNKFVFLDSIPREFLSVFYQKLDLLVLPSDDILESFGWVQIEAMKCGVPCVATNLPGMRIPVKETAMGEIFENRNKNDLVKKIIKVLDKGKGAYRKDMGKLSKFEYAKTIENYEMIFQK